MRVVPSTLFAFDVLLVISSIFTCSVQYERPLLNVIVLNSEVVLTLKHPGSEQEVVSEEIALGSLIMRKEASLLL